ncbi:MAG: methyl-accepting chemotaxis protein [Magnetospirillum sp.]|nr:methyl-accepting chemotaxis protein [Magnetospirillum sp.]
MKLSNYSISQRIGGGFAIVLLLLVMVAAIGAFGIYTARQALDLYSDRTESALLVKEADSQFETLRRHVVKGDHGDATQVLTQIEKLLEQARPGVGTPELATALNGVVGLLGNYRVGLDSLAKDPTVLDDLTKVGDRVSDGMDQLEHAQMQHLHGVEAKAKKDAALHQAEDLALSVLALVVGITAALVIGRGITRPLNAMTAAMDRLANGDLETPVPDAEGKDEIAAMAQALAVFKRNAQERRRLEAQAQAETQARLERQARVERLTADFDARAAELVRAVAGASSTLSDTASGMSAAADQTSSQATAVAAASTQAATNVETVAAAAEELAASITEISRQVSHSNAISLKAADEAKRTDTEVRHLSEAAGRIGEVVQLINDIASQTNLLALNATIEAARAGEAGKGFAVVAGEVKSLANQTTKATEEIGSQISAVQERTRAVVAAINGIGAVIAEVSQIAGSIAAAVEEQAAATAEIARNVEQAAAGTAEVNSTITGVQQAAADTGQAASTVLSASRTLSEQAESLRQTVDGFLSQVKTA